MKFIKNSFSLLKKALGLGFGYVRNHEFISVKTVNELKSLVRSPMVKLGVSLIPGKLPLQIYNILDTIALPILTEVAIIHGIILENEKDSVSVELIIERMKGVFPKKEAHIYADYGARLNYRLADGQLSKKESWQQVQDTYNTFFKDK